MSDYTAADYIAMSGCPNRLQTDHVRTAAMARAYAEGEKVWWCGYHDAQIVNIRDKECWDAEQPTYRCVPKERQLSPLVPT